MALPRARDLRGVPEVIEGVRIGNGRIVLRGRVADARRRRLAQGPAHGRAA
ncbi:MAG: hypothetical protein K2X11_13480 [Acetobacteraceae bacterium]|nr:hypothetical protein [Acetobacteraceae bacterium]